MHPNMKTGFFLLAFILQLSASAQKDCSVLLQGLDSAYVGKCKDGLANGSGEAWGIFHYKGKFANGYRNQLNCKYYKSRTRNYFHWNLERRKCQ